MTHEFGCSLQMPKAKLRENRNVFFLIRFLELLLSNRQTWFWLGHIAHSMTCIHQPTQTLVQLRRVMLTVCSLDYGAKVEKLPISYAAIDITRSSRPA